MGLIDKSDLINKIENLRTKWFGVNNDFANGHRCAFTELLSYLNTVDTKDVALKLDAVVMPSDSSFWVNREELTQFEDGDDVELLIVKK